MRLALLAATLTLGACAAPPPEVDAGLPPADAGPEDAGPPPLTAAGYCEATAELFCDYYLRCGRIVAASPEECRATFLETCNQRYEPRYVDLEDAGLLHLSREGVAACAAHLASVPCAQQLGDLMGPCGAMWVGTQPVGGACGLDVESLTCAPGATCVLGVTLCGACRPAATEGGACGDGGSCAAGLACVQGRCVARRLPGEACSAEQPCVVGARCEGGFCYGPLVVGEGEVCDATHRCRYRSTCIAERCVRSALLGEDCAGRACASGRCVTEGAAQVCRPLLEPGAPCTTQAECRSASCVSGTCQPLPGVCFR